MTKRRNIYIFINDLLLLAFPKKQYHFGCGHNYGFSNSDMSVVFFNSLRANVWILYSLIVSSLSFSPNGGNTNFHSSLAQSTERRHTHVWNRLYYFHWKSYESVSERISRYYSARVCIRKTRYMWVCIGIGSAKKAKENFVHTDWDGVSSYFVDFHFDWQQQRLCVRGEHVCALWLIFASRFSLFL